MVALRSPISPLSNYHELDALDLAALVREGQVTAQEVLEEARARLAAVNPVLNAVVCPMDSLADSLAGQPDVDAPFCGVPFLVEDLMLPLAGSPQSNGTAPMKGFVPAVNSEMADRITEAGLITFGKSLSELGTSSVAASAVFGGTRNPWDLSRNAGGSSGASAAAVAARVVPMAYSRDRGGSIRLSAAYCGVFGFKPSHGLNRFDDTSKTWGGIGHVSSVSVRDSAAYHDVVTHSGAGYTTAAPPEHSYLRSVSQPPRRLKIALITQSPTNTPVHDDCVGAANTAATYCEQIGHHVETAAWDFDGIELLRAFLIILFRCTSRDVVEMARLVGVPEQRMPIELNTRFLAAIGSSMGSDRVTWALEVCKKAARRMRELHRKYDVVLTPTVATPPLTSSALDSNVMDPPAMRFLLSTGRVSTVCSDGFLDSVVRKSLYPTPYTPIASMTGQPAMSVPLYWDRNGLPHGAHFMAADGDDRMLFQLAAQLEAAHPWRKRLPGVCAWPTGRAGSETFKPPLGMTSGGGMR
jgi:amidase